MIRRIIIEVIKLPVHVYRIVISPLIASNCRFQPTCSAYTLQALDSHGPLKGTALAVRRILKCRPGGASGFDPVPPKGSQNP